MIKAVRVIKSLYYANKPLKFAKENTRVQLPYSLEDDIYNNIAAHYNKMDFAANFLNIPFKFAQKGNSILANFGTKTKVFSNRASADDVKKVVDELINNAVKLL